MAGAVGALGGDPASETQTLEGRVLRYRWELTSVDVIRTVWRWEKREEVGDSRPGFDWSRL